MADVLAVSIPNPIDVVGGLAGRGASAVGGALLSAVGQAIARGLADACKRVGDGLLHFLTGPADISFTTGWWASARTHALLGTVSALAAALLVAFIFLALIQGLLAGDPAGMLRAALV